mmetsp:Transcript_19877/g.52059  ORF Transcript_19877/g.52059 Transcript_19877/m.52059 type:complete len:237 (+) Transcript_19877:673-1383(+)
MVAFRRSTSWRSCRSRRRRLANQPICSARVGTGRPPTHVALPLHRLTELLTDLRLLALLRVKRLLGVGLKLHDLQVQAINVLHLNFDLRLECADLLLHREHHYLVVRVGCVLRLRCVPEVPHHIVIQLLQDASKANLLTLLRVVHQPGEKEQTLLTDGTRELRALHGKAADQGCSTGLHKGFARALPNNGARFADRLDVRLQVKLQLGELSGFPLAQIQVAAMICSTSASGCPHTP